MPEEQAFCVLTCQRCLYRCLRSRPSVCWHVSVVCIDAWGAGVLCAGQDHVWLRHEGRLQARLWGATSAFLPARETHAGECWQLSNSLVTQLLSLSYSIRYHQLLTCVDYHTLSAVIICWHIRWAVIICWLIFCQLFQLSYFIHSYSIDCCTLSTIILYR